MTLMGWTSNSAWPRKMLDMDLEFEAGGWTTLRELHAAKPGHTRLQSPFRDSESGAAFYDTLGDRRPFIHDVGTGETHVLRHDRNPSMLEIAYDLLVDEHRPVLANDARTAIMNADGEWVHAKDLSVDQDTLDLLAEARNAPRDDRGDLKEYALLTQAPRWQKAAFKTLAVRLPVAGDGDAGNAAGTDTRRLLAALVKHPVHGEGAECRDWAGSTRALGTWCHYMAVLKPGEPVRFGSKDAMGIIDERGFRIALRPELAGQVSKQQHPEIAGWSTSKLTKRCEAAGIMDSWSNIFDPKRGDPVDKRGRWTVLTAEFVASLDLSTDHVTNADVDVARARAAGDLGRRAASSAGRGYFKHNVVTPFPGRSNPERAGPKSDPPAQEGTGDAEIDPPGQNEPTCAHCGKPVEPGDAVEVRGGAVVHHRCVEEWLLS
jgi:hypothetical protein